MDAVWRDHVVAGLLEAYGLTAGTTHALDRRMTTGASPQAPPGTGPDMASERFVLHVTPNVNGWQVKRQGSDETEWLVDDKDNAVNHARELAKANQPSQIIIHTRDGRIETEHTYGDDPRDIPG